ncbi:hypothetical protein E2C01_024032 [Portunus trituberculatus]|uniref:Uncharacterized protein n=1 Tax=Portunus trituberculatus TaxID=210409 RepID=A0A5B7ECS3_PORTR|nr:hypothetical protein [Portunus trituberculatus]
MLLLSQAEPNGALLLAVIARDFRHPMNTFGLNTTSPLLNLIFHFLAETQLSEATEGNLFSVPFKAGCRFYVLDLFSSPKSRPTLMEFNRSHRDATEHLTSENFKENLVVFNDSKISIPPSINLTQPSRQLSTLLR